VGDYEVSWLDVGSRMKEGLARGQRKGDGSGGDEAASS
jgi:hypothetical protein